MAALISGTGVQTSEDHTKIETKIDGSPPCVPSRKVSIIDEILIKKDVGYKTGHIQYKGKVIITDSHGIPTF